MYILNGFDSPLFWAIPCPIYPTPVYPSQMYLQQFWNNDMGWDASDQGEQKRTRQQNPSQCKRGASLRLLHEAEHVQPHRFALYALKVLNKLAAVVARPLSIVFGKSWLSHGWKRGNITLIFEKGKSRELQAREPHFCAWEDHGMDPPGADVKVHVR